MLSTGTSTAALVILSRRDEDNTLYNPGNERLEKYLSAVAVKIYTFLIIIIIIITVLVQCTVCVCNIIRLTGTRVILCTVQKPTGNHSHVLPEKYTLHTVLTYLLISILRKSFVKFLNAT